MKSLRKYDPRAAGEGRLNLKLHQHRQGTWLRRWAVEWLVRRSSYENSAKHDQAVLLRKKFIKERVSNRKFTYRCEVHTVKHRTVQFGFSTRDSSIKIVYPMKIEGKQFWGKSLDSKVWSKTLTISSSEGKNLGKLPDSKLENLKLRYSDHLPNKWLGT